MENKKLPLKGFVIAGLIGITHLLSPESAEARPVPPNWTPRQVAEGQHRLNMDSLMQNRNNPGTAEEVALRIKEGMIRGNGVVVETALHVRTTLDGRIFDKETQTRAERNDGEWANWWNDSRGISRIGYVNTNVPRPPAGTGQIRKRVILIISEDGRVRKVDRGYRF